MAERATERSGGPGETKPPMRMDEALAEASRCLYCHDAPCSRACPAEVDVATFVRKIRTRNFKGAARKILEANPLGWSCGRACPQAALCEGSCVLLREGLAPVAIGRLQRFAVELAMARGAPPLRAAEPSGPRVAVVGGGPAGIACAIELRRLGCAATLYEARRHLGGLNALAVADHKASFEEAVKEARWLLDPLGIEVRLGVAAGRDLPWEELLARHQAVFIGAGLGRTPPLGIPGEDLAGVRDALDFIEELKTGGRPAAGRAVAVIGGGNTAVEAALQALALGAERAVVLYRRSRAEMPAYGHEVDLALTRGVEVRFLAAPVAVLGERRVRGLRCVRTRLAEADASGRPRPLPLPGSEFEIEVDLLLRATGQEGAEAALGALPGVRFERGLVAVQDETGRTANPRIYAGGDCVSGGREVVHAVAGGRRAARAIAEAFGARGSA